MTEYSLDFIGRTLLDFRNEFREFKTTTVARLEDLERRLEGLETRLDETLKEFREELTVTSAMVMRYSSEHIAWGAMERQIRALTERVAKLESRPPAE